MTPESWAGILFVVFLTLFLIHQRHRLQVGGLFPALYFAMFRTSLGLKAMDYLGKRLRKPLQKLSTAIIALGFLGMILMTAELLRSLQQIVVSPESTPGVGIVQPFVDGVPGTVFVPFFYFMISIFLIATVHEFSHGVLARVWNIHVKSSGFAFLGIVLPVIPAAFVEPEETILKKRPAKQQLAVFAAGPVSNMVFALMVFVLMASVIPPISEAMFTSQGVEVVDYVDGNRTYPAQEGGLNIGDIIIGLDNTTITDYQSFNVTLHNYKPGDIVTVTTKNASYLITLTKIDGRDNGFLGVHAKPNLITKPEFRAKYGNLIPSFTKWFVGLLTWLFVLNLGIGLFNLVPLGPVDGGRMLQVALHHFFSEERANKIWSQVSWFVFLVLIANIVLSFMK